MADLAKVEKDLAPERDKTMAHLGWLRDTFQIVDGSTLDKAAALTKAAKTRWKQLEDQRTTLTKPLLEVKAGIDRLFRTAQEPLLEAEKILKEKMGDYAAAVKAARAQAMTEAAQVAAAGGVPVNIIPEPAQAQGVTLKQVWKATVVDPDAVPREYCSPDLGKIQAEIGYADTSKPPRPIAGVSFALENQVAVRPGRG